MAVKDSEELKNDERYPLGEYSFRVERSSGTSPGYDKFEAICTKGGKNARKSIQLLSTTQMSGWYVEANGDTASVYINVTKPDDTLSIDGIPVDIPVSGFGANTLRSETLFTTPVQTQGMSWSGGGGDLSMTIANAQGTLYKNGVRIYSAGILVGSATQVLWVGNPNTKKVTPAYIYSTGGQDAGFAGYWDAESGEGEQETLLVGRFAIDLEDAGGVGPGSDWTDPGDYDPDWEPDDPTHTLYVEVTGALSGRHNDPIVDPSYSYIPSDKDTVKQYGCGGDGGHGGGGGAGASTVVVHKFATNQANSKEVTAIARRHGYGSGGGKGGKGGDGCILVYY